METRIVIKGIVHGLNGAEGLIRDNHWSAKRKKIKYQCLIKEQTKNKHKGKVSVHYIGYKSILMDWDNFSASFKHLGDSLVREGVILDDNPKILEVFTVEQIKCKRKDQKVEIIIKDL